MGDLLIEVVKEPTQNLGVKHSDGVRAFLIPTKDVISRKECSRLWFDDHASKIVHKENNPTENRIFRPGAQELKDK